MNTTLYNHKPIGTDVKPLIDNADYKLVSESVRNGKYEVYYQYKEKFAFEPKQEKILTDIINGLVL